MPAIQLLSQIIGVNTAKLSKEEHLILEAELFTRVCEELQTLFKIRYQSYFYVIKCNKEMEGAWMEARFIRCLIKDILSTEEYTLSGIAYYIQIPEDVVCDVAIGLNTNPSAAFLRKMIELHKSVRPELYQGILKKITTRYPTE